MATNFPSFEPDSVGTLLDAENAKKVKRFIEAWNNAKIVAGTVNDIRIADGNVVITYKNDAASELHFNNGIVSIDIDGDGFQLLFLANGTSVSLNTDGSVSIFQGISEDSVSVGVDGVVRVYSSSNNKELAIDPSLITEDMGIREIDVCVDGDAKKMLVLASEPYDP